jgi:hypothetical protein
MLGEMLRYSSAAAEISEVVTKKEAWLYEVVCTNVSAGTRYLHVFDAESVPADTAVPIFSLNLLTLTSGSWEPAVPVKFSLGITVVLSSTCGTLTAAVAADALFTVLYAEQVS